MGHLLAVCIALCLAGPASAVTRYYVSPAGDDAGPGTPAAPWQTIAHARDAIAPLIARGLTDDLEVVLQAGTYELSAPLAFGPADGGTLEHSVRYVAAPGAVVRISGGRAITGWTEAQDGLWEALVPGVAGGDWYPEHLVVDGRAATRARTPKAADEAPYLQIAGQELEVEARRLHLTLPAGIVQDLGNPTDIEMLAQGNWAINRMRVQALDPAAGTASFLLPAPDPSKLAWNWPGPGRWFYLENAREFLDEPGEWYLDRATGVLTYYPLPGQDMSTAAAVAPRSVHLLQVQGTAERPVRNLHFDGIGFEHSAWPLPEGNYHGIQACHHATGGEVNWAVVPCALTFEYAEGCSVLGGAVAHCEAGGIELRRGCTDCVIEGNEITDIGGNGVMIGGPDDEAEAPQRNRASNNRVHNCGARFFGAIGIWNGFAAGTRITHNLVFDLPYSGISVGWVWAAQASACKENLIADNHIHHCMGKLCDGGGIYTLGLQPGTVIARNLIHDIYRSTYAQGAPNNGMFIDEGSTGFLFEGNVVYATPGGAVRHNQNTAEGHQWRDNHFDLAVWAPGLIGGALSCPAASVEVPHSDALEPRDITLEAWVKLDHYPQDGDSRRWIVNKNDDEWIDGHYALNTQGDRVGAYLNIGGGQDNSLDAWSEEGVLTLDRWHHLAMTYDGEFLRVYADGRQVAEEQIGRPRTLGTGPLAIGRRQDQYNSFEGLIDEVRVYDRALTPEQLKAHYEAGSREPPEPPAPQEGVIGYWGFDDDTDARAILEAIEKTAGPQGRWRERFGEG